MSLPWTADELQLPWTAEKLSLSWMTDIPKVYRLEDGNRRVCRWQRTVEVNQQLEGLPWLADIPKVSQLEGGNLRLP